jgi:hypothetical protein
MEVGKIAWEETWDEVRDRADHYALMSNEEEVLIEVEFFSENFMPEENEIDEELSNLIDSATEVGAQYLMLTP